MRRFARCNPRRVAHVQRACGVISEQPVTRREAPRWIEDNAQRIRAGYESRGQLWVVGAGLVPFIVLQRTPALVVAIVLSAFTLFGVGVYSAVTLVGDWRQSGLRMVAIGLGAAGIGFLIGRLFNPV